MWDQDLYKRALDFAAQAHGDQKVPGSGLPYVVHLTKVTSEVLRACAEDHSLDVNLAMVCALLHDTLEDTAVPVADVAAVFGGAVASGVEALSKRAAIPKDEQMADSLRRIKQQPNEVAVVKLADRITNLEPPPEHWPVEKRRAYHAQAKVILNELRGVSAWLEQRFEAKLRDYLAFV